MRNVGDTVWYCEIGKQTKAITCPHCLGSGSLTVIMGDGTHYQVACEGCHHYGLPRDIGPGQIKTYELSMKVIKDNISGMQIKGKKIEYHIGSPCCYRMFSEDQVFDTQEEAEIRGAILLAEEEVAEQLSLQEKKTSSRSWAWHVISMRKEVESLTKRLTEVNTRLQIAETKAREQEARTKKARNG